MIRKQVLRATALVLLAMSVAACGAGPAQTKSTEFEHTKLEKRNDDHPVDPRPTPPMESVTVLEFGETVSSPTNSPNNSSPEPQKAAPSATLPEEITLYASPEKALRVEPKGSGESIISTLNGNLKVDEMEPSNTRTLKLARAEKILIAEPGLDRCELSLNQFTDLSAEGKIGFTLMAVDSSSEAGTGCLAKLSTIAMTGFVVEFRKVPVSQLSDERIPLVTLKVSTQKPEQNRE